MAGLRLLCIAAVLVASCCGAWAQPESRDAAAVTRVLVGVREGGPLGAAQDDLTVAIEALGGRVHARYRFLPYLGVQIDVSRLAQLARLPQAASISADRLRQPTLVRSTALIGAGALWRGGLTGAGWTVAVPDTGIDAAHPFLAGKLVGEACFSSNFGGGAGQPATASLCAGGVSKSMASGAGRACSGAADCEHGTQVAGIVAGRDGPDGLAGVAPEATLLALQIYSRIDGGGIAAWDSDLLHALEHVAGQADSHRIAAVNLSLAGEALYADRASCDSGQPALADAVALLRSRGIAVVAAAGNDGARDALAAPACVSGVISVGASCAVADDGFCAGGIDSVAGYSNVASFLELVAPGSTIRSAVSGGYDAGSGTSMAAPHVAGSLALLKQQQPALTVDEALQRLRAAALRIDDTRRGGQAKDLALLDLRSLTGGEAAASTAAGGHDAPPSGAAEHGASPSGARAAVATMRRTTTGATASATATVAPAAAAISPPAALAADAAVAVALGAFHSCVVTGAGGVKCWGRNGAGQLGDGTATDRATPVDTSGLTSGVAAVAAGDFHSCALTIGGGVKCWGDNFFGQLGDGTNTDRTTPVDVAGLASGVIAISADGDHSCALTAAGGVKCWGQNLSGQLGDGTLTHRNAPVDVAGLASGAVAIATGGFHSCSLLASGGVRCWGSNGTGQLGDTTMFNRFTPVDVWGLQSGVSAISAGSAHTCALTDAGGLKCWGSNIFGQLGDGSSALRTEPVDVAGLAVGVASVSAGRAHTCAMTASGGLKCWGLNDSGQLGDGTSTQQMMPVEVSTLASGATSVAAGGDHSCATTATAGIRCWGNNDDGQIGDGTTTDRLVPTTVSGFAGGDDAAPNPFSFTSQLDVPLGSLRTSNTIVPAGFDVPAPISVVNGEYSIGCSGTFRNTPGTIAPGQGVCVRHLAGTRGAVTSTLLTIGGVTGNFASTTTEANAMAAALAAGGFHNCALTAGAGVECWGSNFYGQLGNGVFSPIAQTAPVFVEALGTDVTAIVAGGEHSCALTGGGGVKCWGRNFQFNGAGQLGDGTALDRPAPVAVVGLGSGVASLAAGASHTCAVTTGGGAKCWGQNTNGKLGFNSGSLDVLVPGDVDGLASGVAAMVAADAHTCALTTGGGVKCWGANVFGQLGNGSSNQSTSPVDVTGLGSGMAAIAAGSLHTCARTNGGGVRCWGRNQFGQLGDGTTTDRSTPVDVPGLGGVVAISAGEFHTCAVTNAGVVRCWGNNQFGQLGDGTTTDRLTPVTAITLSTSAAIALGRRHSCARTGAGLIQCWGGNDIGQLGDGTTTRRLIAVESAGFGSGNDSAPDPFGFTPQSGVPQNSLRTSNTIVPAGFGVPAGIAVANGEYSIGCGGVFTSVAGTIDPGQGVCVRHTSAATAGTSVTTTLTIGGESGSFTSTTVAAVATAIDLGARHNCALNAAGGVSCWGGNTFGQVGDGTQTQRLTAVGVAGLASGATEIAAAGFHGCAVVGGGVKCWGLNNSGQLGDGTLVNRLAPVDVSGLASGISAVDGGASHSCALATDGSVKCWGSNVFGRLGDGTVTQRLTPVSVSPLLGTATALALGNEFSCARTSTGGAKCWGNNNRGQLGDGLAAASRSTPGDVSGLASGVVAIGAGFEHACALNTAGGLVCWGRNDTGQLGDGSTTDRSTPVAVVGLASGVVGLAVGSNHTCARLADGTARCWGANAAGQVGDGTTTQRNTPVAVSGLTNVAALAADIIYSCALIDGGAIRCWGSNAFGQLGDGTTTNRSTPTEVLGFSQPADTVPDAFFFTSQFGVLRNQPVTSQAIVPAGYDSAAAISVVNGEYSLGCSGAFTSTAGSISPGQSVCLRHTSSNSLDTSVTTTLTIGGVAGTFTSTTTPYSFTGFPGTIDFDGHSMFTPSVARTVTIENIGVAGLPITAMTPNGPFEVKSQTCGVLPAVLPIGGSCVIQVIFRPPGEGPFAGFLQIDTGAGAGVVQLQGIGERSLVMHYYASILNRLPDPGGKPYWNSEAARVQGLGADLNEVWYAMAMSFFNGAEYLGFNRSNGDFVDDLYRTFLNREADAAGKAFWLGQFNAGLTQEVVLVAFMFSQEFRDFTASIFGDTSVRRELDSVMDFYRGLLSRLPDGGGFNFWVQRFRTAQCAGPAAVTAEAEAISGEFARGAEYAGRNRTNTEYVGDLYNAILRRGGDGPGVQFWISSIASGVLTREQVRQQFVQSPEFQTRVQQIIAAGCLP